MSARARVDEPATGSWARRDRGLLAAGLALAFSPVLLDWGRHWVETPWARYSMLFPALCALAALRETGRPAAAPLAGRICIAAGLAIELLAALGGAIRWARPGLALALFGWLWGGGLASWRSAALLFFAVPVPAFVAYAGSETLLSGLAGPVAAALRGLGAALPDDPPQGFGARGALAQAPLLAGLAWYEASLFARSLGATALGVLACAFAALPLIAAELGLGLLAVSWGSEPRSAGAVLRWGWLPLAAVGVGLVEWRWRRAALR